MLRVACLIIGYIFGLFQTGFIYGKMHGIDIREYGSGNSGTTNALRVLGTKAGLIVLLGDCLKCILAVCLVRFLFGTTHPEIKDLLAIYTAFGTVLGHNFPFYMNFKGGKGIAVTAGFILSSHPYFIIMGIIVFFGSFLTTHYVSLGSLLVYLFYMIELVVLGQMGFFKEMSQGAVIEMYIVAFCMAAMAYWKHRENIKRLLKGTERKTFLTKKNKLEEAGKEENK